MSEYTSYSSPSMGGLAGATVQTALQRRGILYHDAQAWATAGTRAVELEKNLRRELAERAKTSLEDCSSGGFHSEVGRLEAMLSAFCGVPAFRAYAEGVLAGQFHGLREEVETLGRAAYGGKFGRQDMESALRAKGLLESLASEAQKGLVQIEKEALLDTVTTSLRDLGYLVELRGDVVRATLAQTCVWARVNGLGELSMDMSGFTGLSCLKEKGKIEAQLKRCGVALREETSRTHGKPEGGVLADQLRPLFPSFKKYERKKAGPGIKPKVMTING